MLILFPNKQAKLHTKNITFQQANIQPSEAILSPKHSWEVPRINMYGSVIKLDQGYEMFYQCGNALRIGYAYSEDGLVWERPLINATDLSAKAHDIILNNYAQSISENSYSEGYEVTNLIAGYHMPSILYEPDSDKPYKIFAFGEGGYRILYSSNGKQFTEYTNNPAIELLSYQNPVTQKYWCSDVSPCFVDKGVYHAMVKTYELDDQQRTRRCIGHAQSYDFESWSEVKTAWIPGIEEDEIAKARGYHWADFYGLCPFRYGDIFLAYLWLFEIDHELPNGTHLGKIEVFLAYSDDGLSWQRLSDEPLIPWDLNFGEDGGMVTTPSAPVFDDNEIKLYYSDSNYEHGFTEKDYTKQLSAPTWVVRCAQLKKERLVGAYSEYGEIMLNVSSVDFNAIRLNIDCLAGVVILNIQQNNIKLFEKVIENEDRVDFICRVQDELQSYEGKALTMTLSIKMATVFAIEFIKSNF
tara:strand:- start:978 stop:2381 length:1404 start_codon:yes stop_codon:yes gene_type:complete